MFTFTPPVDDRYKKLMDLSKSMKKLYKDGDRLAAGIEVRDVC